MDTSQIFYDNSQFENCYDMTDEFIPQEGIKYINMNTELRPLSKNLKKQQGYTKNKIIGTECVIPSEKQILQLYSITLKRNEYYCLLKIIILPMKLHILNMLFKLKIWQNNYQNNYQELMYMEFENLMRL